MKNDFLDDIVKQKRALIEEKKSYYSSLEKNLQETAYNRYSLFKRQIGQPGRINLIAEIKKASPSQGLLREDFNLMAIAKTYVDHGAAAISVLTEEKFFLGKPAYLKQVSDNFSVPVLMKDFMVDERQFFEARHLGASAVLLIAAILKDAELNQFLKVSAALDLDCLVEVHDAKELERALKAGAEIVGINNRDLTTFAVDMKTCEQLILKIPKDKVIVAESGIKTHDEVKKLQTLGAHAVLIGETFMREKDIGRKIKEIMSET